ncbi:hypothetical protein [Lacticaseibacillus daqingensis]|uniref:hypothetical protein n=1 Tax=Lacticaseibacillus daqingensis TaxID=2486014 RepID=UPI0013DE0F2F|nr:hypothetical protein [Lacticaseibacillus daqingensis]
MKNLAVYFTLFGMLLVGISGCLFLFLNHWQLAEGICFLSGFFILIYAEKIEKLLQRK